MGNGSWENQQSPSGTRVAIALPHIGLIMMEWAIRFRQLVLPPNTDIHHAGHLPIDYSRNVLVDRAQKSGASHIFFLDSDVTPPPNALIQLLADNLPIVTGIYRNKIDGLPAVWRHDKFPDGTPGFRPVAKLLEEGKITPIISADVVGMGCCLINMEVFKKIPYPWFDWTVDLERRTGRGEDFYFCDQAVAAGYKVYADTRVLCGHECLAELPPDFGPMRKVQI